MARSVALAGFTLSLLGCAEQARISLFDDELVDEALLDAELAPPPSSLEDASAPGEPDFPLTPGDAPDADSSDPTSPPPREPDAGRGTTGEGKPGGTTTAALVLRYDFDGVGTTIEDRVGDAHAIALGGAELDARGGLTLDGVDDYVDMPNGVLSSQRSVTIMAWLRWAGGPCWQRVFDFGSTDMGEDQAGRATTSLFLTPASCPSGVLMSMTERDADQRRVAAARRLPTDRTIQVALVLDGDAATSALYIEGAREATAPNPHLMSDLNDVNNWLGRSQWVQDGYLRGRYEELRIYGRALTDDEIAELAARGADDP